jgi:hypothetical protein
MYFAALDWCGRYQNENSQQGRQANRLRQALRERSVSFSHNPISRPRAITGLQEMNAALTNWFGQRVMPKSRADSRSVATPLQEPLGFRELPADL